MAADERKQLEAEVAVMRGKNKGLEDELKSLRDTDTSKVKQKVNPEVEMLRRQVNALRESYGQVSDEAAESRKRAEALQEAALKADQERQENFITDFRRPVEEMRERLTDPSHGQMGVLEEITNDGLSSLATATLTWVVMQKSSREARTDEPVEKLAMETMIEKQRKDLEKMCNAVAKQEEQEKELINYLRNNEDKTGGRGKLEDAKKKLQDQLQKNLAIEMELQRSFDESMGIGQQTYELQCLLQPLKDRLEKIERSITRTQDRRTRQEGESIKLNEDLERALLSLSGTTLSPTCGTNGAAASENKPAPPPPPPPPPPGADQSAEKPHNDQAPVVSSRSFGVQTQVTLREHMAEEAEVQEHKARLDELEASKLELQQKCKAELQEVRSKLRYLQEKHARMQRLTVRETVTADQEDALLRPLEPPPEVEDSESQEEDHSHLEAATPSPLENDLMTFEPLHLDGGLYGDADSNQEEEQQRKEAEQLHRGGSRLSRDMESDLSEAASPTFGEFSGMLYTQKIEELEALCAGLEADIELLQETEQTLLRDRQEKDMLISELMQKAAAEELETQRLERGQARKKKTSRLRFLKKERKGLQEDIEQLQHEAEEAMLDNIRLKNSLLSLEKELEKSTRGVE